MRIAHVITRMIIGGAQENTLLCCQDLIREYDDDVLLITGPSLGPEGDLLGQGRAGGAPVFRIDSLRRAIHPWRDLQAYRAVKTALRDFRPQVVHTHSAKGGMLGRMAAWSLNTPAIVHTVHGAPFHSYQNAAAREFFRRCEKHAARRCHALVCVADAMTDLMTAADVAPRKKFVTIYSGMEVEPFLAANEHRLAMRRQLGFSPEHIVIGKIARLFHLKGHEYVVEAARAVVEACPAARFLWVGDGVLKEELQQQIAQAGLSHFFCFAGLVAPQEIPQYVGAMDILVHASLREGLARALPQALIAGKPVVSFDIDGAREVVLPEKTGFLIEPRQVVPMSQALIELAKDSALRDRFGQEGRRRFTEVFRHQTMTAQLRDLYQRILEEKTENRTSNIQP